MYRIFMRWRRPKDPANSQPRLLEQARLPEPSCSLVARRPDQSEADYLAEVSRRRRDARTAYEGVVQAWSGDKEALVDTFGERWWPGTSESAGVSS